MSNQAKPAPPGPCNHSEGVSFTLAANFTLQSAESTSEFLPSTLADMTYKGLAQVGAGSWERAMSVAQSFVPRDRLPAPPYLGPSFSTGLPHLGHPQGMCLTAGVSELQMPKFSCSVCIISFLFHLFLCGGQLTMQVESNWSDW